MFLDQAVEISIKAAEPTLERIRQDRRRVSAQLRPILDHVEPRLLDNGLQIKSLRRELGIRDESISRRFGDELGLTPWAYITDCRMEVGARMLLNSDLTPWRIAVSVGYGSADSFGRAFRRWCGQTPTQYRKQPSREIAAAELDDELLSPAEIGQALAGELSFDRAEVLVHRLEMVRDQVLAVYPGLRPAPRPAAPPVFGAEFVETSMAESLWKKVRWLALDELRAAVRGQVAFNTPALYHLLTDKCGEVGDKDPERGLALAELALEALEPIAPQLGRLLPSFKAVAWANIAEARMQAGDEDGCEKALAMTDEAVRVAGDDADPGALFRRLLSKTTVRLQQGRSDDALPLFHEMAELISSVAAKAS